MTIDPWAWSRRVNISKVKYFNSFHFCGPNYGVTKIMFNVETKMSKKGWPGRIIQLYYENIYLFYAIIIL